MPLSCIRDLIQKNVTIGWIYILDDYNMKKRNFTHKDISYYDRLPYYQLMKSFTQLQSIEVKASTVLVNPNQRDQSIIVFSSVNG